jgi:hypothetical protein
MPLPPEMTTPYSTRDLITGFYQAGAGNCASIAAIKAALMAFGTRPVFARTSMNGTDHVVVMRDAETEYRFTEAELQLAAKHMSIKGDDELLVAHAHFMFAAMAKRVQHQGNDGKPKPTFESAIASLNDGEYYLEGPKWLGLGAFIKQGPQRKMPFYGAASRFLAANEAVICKSPKHAWFGSFGLCDRYGDAGGPYKTISAAIAMVATEN